MDEDKTVIPNLILTQKNQKPIDPVTKLPKTRPVCLTRTSYNQRANDYLCWITGASIKGNPTKEAISTEDNIAGIDKLNQMIENEEIKPQDLMIGSLDVKALYTSIDTKTAGKLARDNIVKTKTKFEGIDYKRGLKYLALTMTNI